MRWVGAGLALVVAVGVTVVSARASVEERPEALTVEISGPVKALEFDTCSFIAFTSGGEGALTYEWSGDLGTHTGEFILPTMPSAPDQVLLFVRVTDGIGQYAEDDFTVFVTDDMNDMCTL